MISRIYIEEEILDHPRTLGILERFPEAEKIHCRRYSEIFNRKSQNFRLQKRNPALILASKFGQHVLSAPDGYGMGAEINYYFSHMLNCVYDCRYCFLQGMFRSAHYVLFVNYEDFAESISSLVKQHPQDTLHFFSGYDCDSLALDPVTGFTGFFLPLFRSLPETWLELRTKSTQIRSLLNNEPLDNCVVAFSFSPSRLAGALEHRTPSVSKRIEAMKKLQEYGWLIGLRFDPVIYDTQFRQAYRELFQQVFSQIDRDKVHSVSLGSFRLPRDYFYTMLGLYPEEILFASPLQERNGTLGYPHHLEEEMISFCREELLKFIQPSQFYPCQSINYRLQNN